MEVIVWNYRGGVGYLESSITLSLEAAVTAIHEDAWLLLDSMALDFTRAVPHGVGLWDAEGGPTMGCITFVGDKPKNSLGVVLGFRLEFTHDHKWIWIQ